MDEEVKLDLKDAVETLVVSSPAPWESARPNRLARMEAWGARCILGGLWVM